MSSSFLEIVELEDGTFALRRMDDEGGDALVEIQFSPEVESFLGEHKGTVVKAMIGAGVQAAGSISKSLMEAEEKEVRERVLH